MNRREFMRQLEELLSDIPVMERRDALNYYENYFEDAGVENEEDIIRELESPQKVAITIKKDLYGENYNAYMYMNQAEKDKGTWKDKDKGKDNITRNVLIGVLLVVTFPIWIGLIGGLFGIVVGALGVIFGLAVALVAIVGAFLIAGVVLTFVGVVKIFVGFPAVGLVVLSAGLLFLAGFMLGMLAVVWVVGTFIPWAVNGIIHLCKTVFKKRRG